MNIEFKKLYNLYIGFKDLKMTKLFFSIIKNCFQLSKSTFYYRVKKYEKKYKIKKT